MQKTSQSIPIVRITPASIVVYNLNTENYKRSKKQVENERNLTRGEFNGFMSPKTKSKVKRYLDTWFNSVHQINRTQEKSTLQKKPYLTFVTLTLPSSQRHHDNEIKRQCLTPFIETMKRKYDVWNYFWRAEAQENGNIHFHIIIDSYIEALEIRKEWNQCVNKLGYLDEFEKKHGHRDPNSTDIHALKEIRSVTAYVIKYCCKHAGYRDINGRIHGCSDQIKTLMPYEFILEVKDYDLIALAVEEPSTYQRNDVCYTYIGLKVYPFLKKVRPDILQKMNRYYIDIAKDLYTSKDTSLTLRTMPLDPGCPKILASQDEMVNVIETKMQLDIEFEYSSRIVRK